MIAAAVFSPEPDACHRHAAGQRDDVLARPADFGAGHPSWWGQVAGAQRTLQRHRPARNPGTRPPIDRWLLVGNLVGDWARDHGDLSEGNPVTATMTWLIRISEPSSDALWPDSTRVALSAMVAPPLEIGAQRLRGHAQQDRVTPSSALVGSVVARIERSSAMPPVPAKLVWAVLTCVRPSGRRAQSRTSLPASASTFGQRGSPAPAPITATRSHRAAHPPPSSRVQPNHEALAGCLCERRAGVGLDYRGQTPHRRQELALFDADADTRERVVPAMSVDTITAFSRPGGRLGDRGDAGSGRHAGRPVRSVSPWLPTPRGQTIPIR